MTKIRRTASYGAAQAMALFPDGVRRVMAEYQELNTREARAAFADRWIGIWAHDFDTSWTVLYQLLKLIEDDELYADRRRVGPNAPGGAAMHGDRSSYENFAAYFQDRVRQPFATWAQLEETYRYVTEYAPELLARSYGEVTARRREENRAAADREMAKPSHGGDRKSGNFKDNISEIGNLEKPVGNTREQALRRLRKDAETEDPVMVERYRRVLDGELSANAGMVEAGHRQRRRPKTQRVPLESPNAAISALLPWFTIEDLRKALDCR